MSSQDRLHSLQGECVSLQAEQREKSAMYDAEKDAIISESCDRFSRQL